MAGFVSRREVEIEWGDCDPAGIVFYPRYFAMFDRSTALMVERALGVKKIDWHERYGVIGIPMVDTGAKFVIPSKYGDTIVIETRATRLGRTSFDVGHVVRKGDAVAIEARETRVWAATDPDDASRIKGVPLPAELFEALRPD